MQQWLAIHEWFQYILLQYRHWFPFHILEHLWALLALEQNKQLCFCQLSYFSCSEATATLATFAGFRRFWAIAIWLTPDDNCMTLHPNNALHSGHGFFVPNLVTIGIRKKFDWCLTPSDPCMTFDPHECTTLQSRVLPTKFGRLRAFPSNLTCLTPYDPTWPLTPSIQYTLAFGQGFFPPNLVTRMTFLKQFDLWMTFDLWSGHFEKLTTNLRVHSLPPYQVLAWCVEALRNA